MRMSINLSILIMEIRTMGRMITRALLIGVKLTVVQNTISVSSSHIRGELIGVNADGTQPMVMFPTSTELLPTPIDRSVIPLRHCAMHKEPISLVLLLFNGLTVSFARQEIFL